MSRPLTPDTRRALNAPETAEIFTVLLTIAHPDLEVAIRVCDGGADVTSRGALFTAYPFALALPEDEDGRAPRARLSIDNVERQIVEAVRRLTSSPFVTIEIIRRAAPDVVEARFEDFRFTDISYDSQVVEGDLTVEDFTAEPYPAACFSPSLFPGLF
ncbi:MAG: DUF1833 family protein [Alphaproteobacteria bacterium]|jgi:hypothetical protein